MRMDKTFYYIPFLFSSQLSSAIRTPKDEVSSYNTWTQSVITLRNLAKKTHIP